MTIFCFFCSISLVRFLSKCSTKFNHISINSVEENANEGAFSSTSFMQILEVGRIKINSWHSPARYPFSVAEHMQWDDIIKRAPVKPKTGGNHEENVMALWHLCLFHVLCNVTNITAIHANWLHGHNSRRRPLLQVIPLSRPVSRLPLYLSQSNKGKK